MKAHGLARLGRDAELRTTGSGEVVASLSLAFTYGKRDASGNRPTQWVDAAFWGKRAESLAPYLVKGSQIVVYLDDVRIETFQGKKGEGHKLAAKVADIELIAGQGAAQAPARAPAPAPRAATPAPAGGSGFDDFEDDIPF